MGGWENGQLMVISSVGRMSWKAMAWLERVVALKRVRALSGRWLVL